MKYGKNYIEWQTSIQGMNLSDFRDYLRKREGSFKHPTGWYADNQVQVCMRNEHYM